MKLSDLNDAKYISLETFKKNGQGVKTPVWQVAENGRLYVWTEKEAWKTKRIRNNNQVRVAACDMRGNVSSEWVDAQATELSSPDEDAIMRKRLAKKYGIMYRIFGFMGSKRERTVIEISPN